MRGVSPFIATILLIAFSVAVGGLMMSWYMGLTKTQAGLVSNQTEQETTCNWGGIRVLTETIKCNFAGNGSSTNPEYLNFSVHNSGSINLYNLKVQVYVGGIARTYDLYEVTTNLTFTPSYPLKPEEIKTVAANITEDLPFSDADWIRVITQCSNVNSGYIRDVDCTP
jgi:FlaG/FlaF family flagellin (archaellin)